VDREAGFGHRLLGTGAGRYEPQNAQPCRASGGERASVSGRRSKGRTPGASGPKMSNLWGSLNEFTIRPHREGERQSRSARDYSIPTVLHRLSRRKDKARGPQTRRGARARFWKNVWGQYILSPRAPPLVYKAKHLESVVGCEIADVHFGGRKRSGAFDTVWPSAKMFQTLR